MKLADYQINSIKKIYGNNSWIDNNIVNNSDVINFYEKNYNFDKSVELPDKMCAQGGNHALTKYPLKQQRLASLDDSLSYQISYIAISANVIKDTLSYYKLINSKDVNWENAYLPALSHIQKLEIGDVSYIDIQIKNIDNAETIELDNKTKKTVNFTFGKQIKNGVSNTYELLNIIDYLLYKINAIYFMLNIVKNQYITVSEYEDIVTNRNNNE